MEEERQMGDVIGKENDMGIEVKNVLRMKEGNGDTSYSNASYLMKEVLSYTKPLKEKAIREFYSKASPNLLSICIADVGCSSVELNNMSVVYEIITIFDQIRRQLGRHGPIEYQIALNDLPTNDFNTVFKSLPSFENLLKQQNMGDDSGISCFVTGVPGSFYGRCFPTNSLHFVHSSYALHWLSQVPITSIEDNKREICIGHTSSLKVVKAYCDQFQKDFLTFLRYRSKEVVVGGMMMLTTVGRQTNQPYCKDSYHAHGLLSSVLNDMVKEGYMEEEKVNTFNLPVFLPCLAELEDMVQKEGSFRITQAKVFKVNWLLKDFNDYDFTKCIRSVLEPLLISHFGASIIDQVFKRFHNYVHASLAIERRAFTSLTILLSRVG